MYNEFKIDDKIVNFVNEIEKSLSKNYDEIDNVYETNQLKVLKAFIDSKISESTFVESTGYGYTDIGRDQIELLYSKIFHTEDSLVRQQIVSGTHAISLVLFSLVKSGDKILSINGLPYDTIRASIGLNNEPMSLKDFGVSFDYVDLKDNTFNKDAISKKLTSDVKLIMIQRSRGYSDRKALSLSDIEDIIKFIKNINKNVLVMVDNCYGEFVDTIEPSDIGADVICGSLIKNPGGSLVKSGGYICGKKDIIKKCSYRLTAPGIGKEVGISFNQNRNVLQGMYLAPQIVANAKKIVKLFANTYEKLGIKTIPKAEEKLNDIVISLELKSEENLTKFCKAIQETSPVDSFVTPIKNNMPGYDKPVIMAAGNFISGSSIELSCDAPISSPYYIYMQGGVSYYQGKLALMKSLDRLDLIK